MPKIDDFLKEYYLDTQITMRSRSETEYRLLNMFIVVNPIIITAIFALSELVDDKVLFLALTLSVATLLAMLTILLTLKIKAEHEIYVQLGQHVVKVWKYFGLFEKGVYINDAILEKTVEDYGTGEGYLRTLRILWGIPIFTSAIVSALGIIRFIVV